MEKFDVKNIDLSSKAIAQTSSNVKKDDVKDSKIVNGPVYDIIKSNAFKVRFSDELMTPYINVLGISKPKIDLRSSIQENKQIKMYVSYINKRIYFGKPTVITNVVLDSDIISMLYEFNNKRPEYIEVTEYNEYDVERIITRYENPYITEVEFSANDSLDEGEKYIILTIEYDSIDQSYPEV